MSPKAAPLKPKISAEQEWVKRSQRRRPQLPTNEKANQLIDAKLELARAAKEELELERVRKGELFEVEKRKKLLEEEMLKLQALHFTFLFEFSVSVGQVHPLFVLMKFVCIYICLIQRK
ncbi:unnamed protein product [Acanthoscelides obtectus]|uniref:Uncharacterized protein n=1 Tax=Acanthoscelides obtectus TaxID=200917 RepID=A0A9P0VSB5_ACAOB|nr:unnamed protein product [Acanthoscelides obtectus]CAK1623384.1 hypothetical protein AOBTE_LOCUS1971 [Acanthoscelides obtectus]